MSEDKWVSVSEQLPPRGCIVMTKIDDGLFARNEQRLQLGIDNNLWWHADGFVYVYYTPTHWHLITT